jgi:hypothetical protein
MSDNVVSLFGGEPIRAADPASSEPLEGLVRELEQLLEAARAGEITGFAGTFQHRSGSVGYAFAGSVGGYAMLGGLECVRLRLAQRAIQRDL